MNIQWCFLQGTQQWLKLPSSMKCWFNEFIAEEKSQSVWMNSSKESLKHYFCALPWLGMEEKYIWPSPQRVCLQKRTQCTRNSHRDSLQLNVHAYGIDCEVVKEFKRLQCLRGWKRLGVVYRRWKIKRNLRRRIWRVWMSVCAYRKKVWGMKTKDNVWDSALP